MAELVYYQHAGITLQNVIELSLAKGTIGLFYIKSAMLRVNPLH